MATFSVNKVKHLYVVPSANASDFKAYTDQEKTLYFGMKDAKGNAVRSDQITNILRASATAAESMQRKLKTYKITATDADMVKGQVGVVRLSYKHFVGISDEDSYFEYGSALMKKTGDDVEVFLKELAKNLYDNTRKQGMVDVKAIVNSNEKDIKSLGDADVVTAIIVREIEQAWVRGVRASEPVDFTVVTPFITDGGVDAAWATVTDETANQTTVLGNGKKVADMEYFHLGDRADIYRMMGWPNHWPSEDLLLVDPTKQYDLIDIHYAYIGASEDTNKGEKDITLAIPAGTVDAPDHSIASAVLTAINATGAVTITEPDEWNAEEE